MVLYLQLSNPFGGAGSSPAVVDSFAFALSIYGVAVPKPLIEVPTSMCTVECRLVGSIRPAIPFYGKMWINGSVVFKVIRQEHSASSSIRLADVSIGTTNTQQNPSD